MRQGEGRICEKTNGNGKHNTTLQLMNGSQWTTAVDFDTVFSAINKFKSESRKFRFVAGNTANGKIGICIFDSNFQMKI